MTCADFLRYRNYYTPLTAIEAWAGEPSQPPQSPPLPLSLTEAHAFVPIAATVEARAPGDGQRIEVDRDGSQNSIVSQEAPDTRCQGRRRPLGDLGEM